MIVREPLPERDAWLERRLNFINASEIATVCGEASYGSLAELYAEKKGLRPPLVDSGVLKRGRWGESAVFQAVTETLPEWQITRASVHVVDRDRRIACTPDGFAMAPDRDGIGIVQRKVVARSRFRHWLAVPDDSVAHGEATPPTAYVLQTLFEMLLNDCRWGVLAVLINSEFDWSLRLFHVERDAIIEERMLARAAAFWRDHLDPGIMPPFEPQKDEALVKALYPHDDGKELDLSGDNRALAAVDELIETQAAMKRVSAQEKALKTELQGKLREYTYGRLADGRRLSWKQQHRKAFAVDATTYRVLRILKETAV
jgi:predicted phage-related endonuclease